jgi:hypothetical protein
MAIARLSTMKTLQRVLPAAALLLCLLSGAWSLSAQQITAVQFSQNASVVINLQSQRGQPISTAVNTGIGSDGMAPTIDSSTGGAANLTTRQFAALVSLGGVTATTNNLAMQTNNPYLQGTTSFSAVVAQNMQLPVGADSTGVQFILRRARVGAPYVAQAISFYFGSVIPVPSTDVTGTPLTNGTQYWLAQPAPYFNYTNGNANAYFYYSSNAGAVFATQPGSISVTWVTFARYTTNRPTYTNQLGPGIPSPALHPELSGFAKSGQGAPDHLLDRRYFCQHGTSGLGSHRANHRVERHLQHANPGFGQRALFLDYSRGDQLANALV